MLPEPFVLRGTANEANFEEFQLPFIPLRERIEALAAVTGNSYVLHDGVHPTHAGHELISRELYGALKQVL